VREYREAHINRTVAMRKSDRSSAADDMDINDVAQRLGKSPRWLVGKLTEDTRRPPHLRKFQHHFWLGASKRWDEERYQRLKAALIADSEKRRVPAVSMSSSGTVSGTSTALFGLAGKVSALERVLAFQSAGPRKTR
jgi:hypothetical protein